MPKLTRAVIAPARRVRHWIAIASASVSFVCGVLVLQHWIDGAPLVANRREVARAHLRDVEREEQRQMLRQNWSCPVAPPTLDQLDRRVDPWGRDVRVICGDGYLTAVSAGEDGVFGTDDDVR